MKLFRKILVRMSLSFFTGDKSDENYDISDIVVMIMLLIGLVIAVFVLIIIVIIALSPIGWIASLFPNSVDSNLIGYLHNQLVKQYEPNIVDTSSVIALPIPANSYYNVQIINKNVIILELLSNKDTPILAPADGYISNLGVNYKSKYIDISFKEDKNYKLKLSGIDYLYAIKNQEVKKGEKIAEARKIRMELEISQKSEESKDEDKDNVNLVDLLKLKTL